MKILRIAAAAGAALVASATLSSAATMTTVVDFNGLNGNITNYVQDGYNFSTLNLQNSTQCATGACIQEYQGQGSITTLTRVDGGMFDLDSFYFSLQGNGQNAENSVKIEADTGTTFTYAIGDDDSDGAVGGLINLYDNGNNAPGALLGNGLIDKSQGANGPNYIVSYDAEFDGVKSISWFGPDTANTRIDNIVLSRAMTVVPLPATGLMLLFAVAGLGAATRMRK